MVERHSSPARHGESSKRGNNKPSQLIKSDSNETGIRMEEGFGSKRERGDTSPDSKFKSLMKPVVKGYIKPLLSIIVIGTAIPFVLILIRAAYRPGLLYCGNSDCPTVLESIVSDTAMLIIGLLVYAFFAFLCILVLLSSGSWMEHAFRDKVIVISTLYCMFWSVFQLAAPAAHRTYVIPYHIANPMYEVTINYTSANSASIGITEFYSVYYEGKDLRVAVQVYEVPNKWVKPQEIDPFYHRIYTDNWEATTAVVPNVFIQRDISNLRHDKYYLWTIVPAKKQSNDAYPSTTFLEPVKDINDPYLLDIYNGTLSDSRASVDLRGYAICLWHELTGCS